jgi:hypothetical protein
MTTPARSPAQASMSNLFRLCESRASAARIHCVAGDATGIILAAAVTASLGLPMWLDLIVEYLAGF